MARASWPSSEISRATVVIVESEELGSGGKGPLEEGEEVDLAETITMVEELAAQSIVLFILLLPAYPFFARSIATCRPIPLEAPITRATGWFGAMPLELIC